MLILKVIIVYFSSDKLTTILTSAMLDNLTFLYFLFCGKIIIKGYIYPFSIKNFDII